METVVENKETSMSTLSGKLRLVAGALIILSGAVFLLQDYYSADSTRRLTYFMLLNFAVMFSGVACAAILKEPKGARTGLGAGLGLLPMYFLQVGAVVFATFGANLLNRYPNMLHFQTLPSVFYGGIVALSLAAFAGLSIFAFRCLAGTKSLHFASAYTLVNLALLIPIRGNIAFTAIVCILETALLFYLERKHFQKEASLSAPEGIFSRGILFLPVLLPAIREASLYSQGYFAQALALGITAFVIGQIIAVNHKERETILSVNSLIVAQALYYFANGLIENFAGLQPFAPLLGFGLIGAYQYRVALLSNKYRRLHTNLGSALITYGCYNEMILHSTPAVAAVMLVVGLLLGALGNTIRSKWTMASAVLISSYSAFEIIHFIYMAKVISTWMIFGISGILILFISSYLEKHSLRFQLKFNEIVKSWN